VPALTLKTSVCADEVMQHAHRLFKGVDEFYLCRFMDCLYVCRNTQWIDNGGQYCCPACSRQYRPWVQSGGRTTANKVLVLELTGKDIQAWSECGTKSAREVERVLKGYQLAGEGKAEVVFPILWVETTTQALMNRYKEIHLGLQKELLTLHEEERAAHVMSEIQKSAVPALFSHTPFSPVVKAQVDHNNLMRPDRPWKYDHILGGTEGCFMEEPKMQEPLDNDNMCRLFGLAEMLVSANKK
jgi:hypothetical protein